MKNKTILIYAVTLAAVVLFLAFSLYKTDRYNKTTHRDSFTGSVLFGDADPKTKAVSVRAVPRSSTWTKVFDLNHEGITEHNFQAYTYDFSINNNTKDG